MVAFVHQFNAMQEELNVLIIVYNLFILYNRNHLFPQNALRISYDEKSKHGLIELPSNDPKYLLERLFMLDSGIIYSMTIRTKKDHVSAENFRTRILKETNYKSSTTDSAIPIYAQYKNISYGKIGITNNPTVYNLFDKKIIYSDSIEKLVHESLEFNKKEDKNIIIKELMIKVRDNHTYINLINFIFRTLGIL